MGAGQVIVQTLFVLPILYLHVGYLLRVLWLLSVHLEIDETRACLQIITFLGGIVIFMTTDWYLLVHYGQVFHKWNIIFLFPSHTYPVYPHCNQQWVVTVGDCNLFHNLKLENWFHLSHLDCNLYQLCVCIFLVFVFFLFAPCPVHTLLQIHHPPSDWAISIKHIYSYLIFWKCF